MEKKLRQILKDLGFRTSVKGYRYIITAIAMFMNGDLTKGCLVKYGYYKIGKYYDSTATRVERAIRRAIEIAYDSSPEVWKDMLNITSRPTNREAIYSIGYELMDSCGVAISSIVEFPDMSKSEECVNPF